MDKSIEQINTLHPKLKGYVYTLSSSENIELVRYIGYTTKPYGKRLIEHLSESKNLRTRKDKWIQNVVKNGFNIIEDILVHCDSIDDLKVNECQLILLFKSLGAKLTNGTLGGDGTHRPATEYLKKWNSDTKSKELYFFDYKSRMLLGSFKNSILACNALGVNSSSISYTLTGKYKQTKGYVFSRNPEYPIFDKPKRTAWNKGKPSRGFQKFRTTSVILKSNLHEIKFNSIREAADFLSVTTSAIVNAHKRNGLSKGYSVIKNKLCNSQ